MVMLWCSRPAARPKPATKTPPPPPHETAPPSAQAVTTNPQKRKADSSPQQEKQQPLRPLTPSQRTAPNTIASASSTPKTGRTKKADIMPPPDQDEDSDGDGDSDEEASPELIRARFVNSVHAHFDAALREYCAK